MMKDQATPSHGIALHSLWSSISADFCFLPPLPCPFPPTPNSLLCTFWQVLLVSEDKNDGVPHLSVVNNPVKFLPGLVYPVPVRTVHHEYEALGAGVVVTPQWSDLVLTSNILPGNNNVTLISIVQFIVMLTTYPDVKFNIFVRDCLYVKPNCGYCIHWLTQLQFV